MTPSGLAVPLDKDMQSSTRKRVARALLFAISLGAADRCSRTFPSLSKPHVVSHLSPVGYCVHKNGSRLRLLHYASLGIRLSDLKRQW